jgi:hypothetical protein
MPGADHPDPSWCLGVTSLCLELRIVAGVS